MIDYAIDELSGSCGVCDCSLEIIIAVIRWSGITYHVGIRWREDSTTL